MRGLPHDALIQHQLLRKATGKFRYFFRLLSDVGADQTLGILQLQLCVDAEFGHHPVAKCHLGTEQPRAHARLPLVPAPTIERLQTPDGVIWRITYAGMTRYHRQDWQAWWLYELARAAYYAGGGTQS